MFNSGQSWAPTRPHRPEEDGPKQESVMAAGLPLLELDLLHHWHTTTSLSLAQNEALGGVFQIHVPQEGLSYPFLMHSILAISALHLSQRCPDSCRQIYNEAAMRHHSIALWLCAPLLSDVTSENCHALFACSLLIASFSFAAQGRNIRSGPTGVGEVVETFKLVRGASSIAHKALPWIEQGQMGLLLRFNQCAQRTPRSRHVFEVHAQVEALIQRHTNGGQGDAKEVVSRSTKRLLDVFDSCIASDNQSTILAWPALVDAEYLDLILQKEPDYLVILAHYGAVLHIMTKAWWMEGWGKFLVLLAGEQLGLSGQSAIAWPLSVFQEPEEYRAQQS